MTKKDYERFAEMFRVELNNARNAAPKRKHPDLVNTAYERIATLNDLISETADIFQSDNSRFNRDRFFKAVYNSSLELQAVSQSWKD